MVPRKSFYGFVLIGVAAITLGLYFAGNTAVAAPAAPVVVHEENQSVPIATTTESEQKPAPTTPAPAVVPDPVPTTPVSLSIPSINLNTPIIEVGLNERGEMDVPDGSTNNVGWYKSGTVPGDEGSAVLDAHVFAALKNLRYAKVGDSIYVKDAAGTTRHFVIRSSIVYEVASVPRELLFNRSGGTYLNVITCAGTYVPTLDTYDHRLVVYAELVSN